MWNKLTGVLLAETTATGQNDWAYGNIDPVDVDAGVAYTVAVEIDSSGGTYRSGVSYPQTHGDIRIDSSTYVRGTARPTNANTSTMYGQADIGFVASDVLNAGYTPWKNNAGENRREEEDMA